MTQSHIRVRTLDEAGNVCDCAATILPKDDHANMRLQRGERIIRDLRPGSGKFGEQCGLAGVRESDQSGIRDAAQFKHEIPFFAWQTRRALAWRLVRG